MSLSDHYPDADIDFIINSIRNSELFFHEYEQDGRIYFVKKGSNSIAKRISQVNKNKDVCFNHANSLAHIFNFYNELDKWYIENKNWKDGAYFQPQNGHMSNSK